MGEKYGGIFQVASLLFKIEGIILGVLAFLIGTAGLTENPLAGLLIMVSFAVAAVLSFAVASVFSFMLDLGDAVDHIVLSQQRHEKQLGDIEKRVEYTRRKVSEKQA